MTWADWAGVWKAFMACSPRKNQAMPNVSPDGHSHVPVAFHQHNEDRYQRTIQVTQKAIANLEGEGQTVTLVGVVEATRAFDERGKGLSPATILRNPEARELFHQHSSAYQQRQQQTVRVRRKRSQSSAITDVRTVYRGLRTADLIQVIEDLKPALADARNQQAQLQVERDKAYRLRDEVLQQNAQQLAALTQLTHSAQTPSEK